MLEEWQGSRGGNDELCVGNEGGGAVKMEMNVNPSQRQILLKGMPHSKLLKVAHTQCKLARTSPLTGMRVQIFHAGCIL
jgi:hypothetical protein